MKHWASGWGVRTTTEKESGSNSIKLLILINGLEGGGVGYRLERVPFLAGSGLSVESHA